jgi:DNA-directed RNA polymerase specialized sigma24 family protein
MILPPTADPAFSGQSWHESALSPSEMLARIGRGDVEALGSFYDQWERSVHGFVARLIRDPDARERVVEAVFWAVWEHADSYDSVPVDQWVHALALVCCRAELTAPRAETRGRGEARHRPLRLHVPA